MDLLDDLNPLHWINAINDAIGSSMADVLEFLGITDPAVNPDGIREIAKVWKDLADAIGQANHDAGQAVVGLALHGEAGRTFSDRATKVRGVATQVEDALHKGHDGLNKLADQAHELISQVGVLAAQIAEFEVAGLALSVLTGPLSDVAAALAAGSRARRIIEIFGEVEAMVVRAGKMIEDLCAEIGGLSRILKALQTIAKMAYKGAKIAGAWDLMFDPKRLTDPGSLGTDLAFGAGGEIGFAALGKGLTGLREALGKLGVEGTDGLGLFGGKADGLLSELDKDGYVDGAFGADPYVAGGTATKAEIDAYRAIAGRADSFDIPLIAQRTGIDPKILEAVKQHFFRTPYELQTALNESEHGLFTPDSSFSDMWNKAAGIVKEKNWDTGGWDEVAKTDPLDTADIDKFRHWMAHEYVESKLMQDANLPYRVNDPANWDALYEGWKKAGSLDLAGAHDIAPNSHDGTWDHWGDHLGLTPPDGGANPSLSNMDSIVADLMKQLKAKGRIQ